MSTAKWQNIAGSKKFFRIDPFFEPFAPMFQKCISEYDFKALCDLTKIDCELTESKKEEKQKIIRKIGGAFEAMTTSFCRTVC